MATTATTWSPRKKAIHYPDVQIRSVESGHRYCPTRGYGASLIVFDQAWKPVGWIDTRVLGFETAKAWIESTGWKPADFIPDGADECSACGLRFDATRADRLAICRDCFRRRPAEDDPRMADLNDDSPQEWDV